MSASTNGTIEGHLQKGHWDAARKLIERALTKQPDNHWLLTQLGVTYYEQGQYRESLTPLLASLDIVPDCPLTLWNLAGALDAIGKSEAAVEIYTWLLRSKKSANDDPCWESKEWANALKADCVYRLGVCFKHLKRWESSDHCFRQYINLLMAGRKGTYTVDDAMRHIREVPARERKKDEKEVRNAIDSTLGDSGVKSIQGRRRKLPRLSVEELLAT